MTISAHYWRTIGQAPVNDENTYLALNSTQLDMWVRFYVDDSIGCLRVKNLATQFRDNALTNTLLFNLRNLVPDRQFRPVFNFSARSGNGIDIGLSHYAESGLAPDIGVSDSIYSTLWTRWHGRLRHLVLNPCARDRRIAFGVGIQAPFSNDNKAEGQQSVRTKRGGSYLLPPYGFAMLGVALVAFGFVVNSKALDGVSNLSIVLIFSRWLIAASALYSFILWWVK